MEFPLKPISAVNETDARLFLYQRSFVISEKAKNTVKEVDKVLEEDLSRELCSIGSRQVSVNQHL